MQRFYAGFVDCCMLPIQVAEEGEGAVLFTATTIQGDEGFFRWKANFLGCCMLPIQAADVVSVSVVL